LHVQPANDARSGNQPVQQPALRVEVLLFHFEVIDVQELSPEEKISDRRLQIGRRSYLGALPVL